ncbi:stromelysin-3 [Cololabis saira]|uniref:stromelysin-3 n=1 Tax=Cololabis saira TaxID=129043 RepID=UPI002AD4C3BB|nr:stromelysin-3 [Cololabis saira]
MRTSLLACCCIFALQCFPSMFALTLRGPGRSRAAPVSEKFLDLRKRGKVAEDLVKEVSSSTSTPSRPRCGVPDYLTQEVYYRGRHRQRRFVLNGGRWDKTDLTYRIVRFPRQLSEETVRRVFREALKIWSDVTPLRFIEVHSGKADIRINFTRYWHSDHLPFDGRGGILAHAFFPKTSRQGDVHFDADEVWTLGNHVGTDLLQVAAHEFGHALGLQHSRERGAVMAAYYTYFNPLRLSEDDKRGIQFLYGPSPRTVTRPPAPPPTPPPPPPPRQPPPPRPPLSRPETNDIPIHPDACRTHFDAVSMIRGELFFFKSGYVWRIRDRQLESGYPALASRHWAGIPDYIDAAFEDKSGNIWFFQGRNYWVFDAERQIRGPESLDSLGLFTPGIQAALRWGHDPNYNTYFFRSGSYWRFSPGENRVESTYPRSMQEFSDIPEDVDAAFRDADGYAHFIRGQQYWKFDHHMHLLRGYPRYLGMDYFNCRSL